MPLKFLEKNWNDSYPTSQCKSISHQIYSSAKCLAKIKIYPTKSAALWHSVEALETENKTQIGQTEQENFFVAHEAWKSL